MRLISECPSAHGVFDKPEAHGREVLCTVRSASYRDIAAAGTEGLRPEIVFRLAHDFEYQDEHMCEYAGKLYNIDRVYFADESDWVELTCSRSMPNA